MIDIIWTKFRDCLPAQDKVWVSDFKEINLIESQYDMYWKTYCNEYPERVWSYIEFPEVPHQEEWHLCSAKGGCYCAEIESLDGTRSLVLNIPVTGRATHLLHVYQCPFCGYPF